LKVKSGQITIKSWIAKYKTEESRWELKHSQDYVHNEEILNYVNKNVVETKGK